jgi:hypothetical protein
VKVCEPTQLAAKPVRHPDTKPILLALLPFAFQNPLSSLVSAHTSLFELLACPRRNVTHTAY